VKKKDNPNKQIVIVSQ